jgi:hypothetical protein
MSSRGAGRVAPADLANNQMVISLQRSTPNVQTDTKFSAMSHKKNPQATHRPLGAGTDYPLTPQPDSARLADGGECVSDLSAVGTTRILDPTIGRRVANL